ncbi:proline-rich receptor-like protein kinase PERK1 [Rosa sericea]
MSSPPWSLPPAAAPNTTPPPLPPSQSPALPPPLPQSPPLVSPPFPPTSLPALPPVHNSIPPVSSPLPAVVQPPPPPVTSPPPPSVTSPPPPSLSFPQPPSLPPPTPLPSRPSPAPPPKPTLSPPPFPTPKAPHLSPPTKPLTSPPSTTPTNDSPPPTLSTPLPPVTTTTPPPPLSTPSNSPPPPDLATLLPPAATAPKPPPTLARTLPPSLSNVVTPLPSNAVTPLPTTTLTPPPLNHSPSPSLLPATLQVQKPQPKAAAGLVAGCVIVGVVVVFLILGIVLICYKRRSRKNNAIAIPEDYHKPPSLGPKDGYYDAVQPHHNVPQPGVHVIRVLSSTSTSPMRRAGGFEVLYAHQPQWLGFPMDISNGTFTYDQLLVATNGFSDANLLGQGGFGYVHKGVLPGGKEVAVKQLKTGSRQGEREFHAEVDIISRVHHKHLVSLVGHCIKGAERLLVYEFVPNNTLEFHLHGLGQTVLEWEIRLKIATGSAKGLAYLHEDCNPKIIHRDIKASNILVDQKFEAKARPLLTQALEDGAFDALVDPQLETNYNKNEMARMVACAAACVRHSAWLRPRMSQIVHALEGVASLMDLRGGVTPGNSAVYNCLGNSHYNSRQYEEDLKNSTVTMPSQEYGISIYTETTSEYGLNPSGSSSETRQTI